MKTKLLFPVLVALLFCVFCVIAIAQTTESISKSLGVYVFPTKGQTAEVQSKDESACYDWAKEQTGYDPKNPTKVEVEEVEQARGGAVVGAAKGAAAGAAIGAIAGDTGEGAAIGAIAGGLRGRRATKAQNQQAQQQASSTAEAKEKEMLDNYKKAFSACMEGKGYTVK